MSVIYVPSTAGSVSSVSPSIYSPGVQGYGYPTASSYTTTYAGPPFLPPDFSYDYPDYYDPMFGDKYRRNYHRVHNSQRALSMTNPSMSYGVPQASYGYGTGAYYGAAGASYPYAAGATGYGGMGMYNAYPQTQMMGMGTGMGMGMGMGAGYGSPMAYGSNYGGYGRAYEDDFDYEYPRRHHRHGFGLGGRRHRRRSYMHDPYLDYNY